MVINDSRNLLSDEGYHDETDRKCDYRTDDLRSISDHKFRYSVN